MTGDYTKTRTERKGKKMQNAFKVFKCSKIKIKEANQEWNILGSTMGLPRWLSGQESACQWRRLGLDPWVGKIPWGRKWQPIPVLLPGESHGKRSLVGYSPRRRRVKTTERLSTHAQVVQTSLLPFPKYSHLPDQLADRSPSREHGEGSHSPLLIRSTCGRSPGGGHGNPLQYSCLENPMDRGAWWSTVHRVAKSQTRLKRLSMHACVPWSVIIWVTVDLVITCKAAKFPNFLWS